MNIFVNYFVNPKMLIIWFACVNILPLQLYSVLVCTSIYIHCVEIMHVHGIFDFYFKILLSVWRKWISRKMVVFTQTCMNVVYFTWNVCNVSCHFFSSMDRNYFYLITVIFSEYMTYVCTNFLRLCESEGIEYCYSRWLWMQCIKCFKLDENGQMFSPFSCILKWL